MGRSRVRPGLIWRSGKAGKISFAINASGGTDEKPGFEACARIGDTTAFRRGGRACAKGKTPRVALGRALAKLGRLTARRKGAFGRK